MKEFVTFRKMITPWLVQIIFWVATLVFILTAAVDIIHHESWRVVLEILILGPLAARIICEVLILFFRMNDNLSAISRELRKEVGKTHGQS
jgi:hypothetical protein